MHFRNTEKSNIARIDYIVKHVDSKIIAYLFECRWWSLHQIIWCTYKIEGDTNYAV